MADLLLGFDAYATYSKRIAGLKYSDAAYRDAQQSCAVEMILAVQNLQKTHALRYYLLRDIATQYLAGAEHESFEIITPTPTGLHLFKEDVRLMASQLPCDVDEMRSLRFEMPDDYGLKMHVVATSIDKMLVCPPPERRNALACWGVTYPLN